ncbi:MAG TPA: exonuclease domain-containing protein, partial [Casimicrobiaceae bacterium]|nr:exonuclease domain-containing protein [Casimicrobiaceae bacterium]
FVDIETTGTRAGADRITEIGIVRVDDDGRDIRITEWESLVDPEVPIPPAIQALTGITDAMVRSAPSFSTIARDVLDLLAGCVFVAHNARFDYGFLKHAFARLSRSFSARVLCTVRLSRRLFPQAEGGHGLDALIARHALPISNRHRALGDARAIWAFVELLYREQPAESVDAAIKRILRMPSLPPQLAPDAIDALPESPGVYLFYGDNPLPLYIGKSVNLRERVAAHFSQDWRTETDLRMSREIRRIEYEKTAGELGALLREAVLVKARLPAYNRALRRKEDAGVAHIRDGVPRFVSAQCLASRDLAGAYGPFTGRASFRAALRAIVREHRLCARRVGLERGTNGPCFARQLERCNGACTGEESAQQHDARLADALAPLAIPRWPMQGVAYVREAESDGERVDVHVFRDWCWVGTARDEAELTALCECPPNATFDLDVTRLLLRRHRARTLDLRPLARE